MLEEDLMVDILTDIAFIKAAKMSSRKVFDEKGINPENYILRKYGIDSIVFAENNAWYSGQLEEYAKMFTKVKANIEQSKIKYEKLKKEEDSIKKIQDSIKKIKDTLSDKEKLLELEELEGSKSEIENEMELEIERAKSKRFRNPSGKE
ncbi:DUF4296 domain-containing protein [Aquimarina sp. AU474]|uniref:DUF4296 domain-containing protein n=1 Tax=Aquimarina sp. AU474 TaxID=2108529 RepID=UPI00135BD35A|nr:DUF4296 domain-containing protein [Aquimarina sp. AU474]